MCVCLYLSTCTYVWACVPVSVCIVHVCVWWGRGALGSAQPGLIYVFSTSTCFHQSRDTCFWTKEAFLGLQHCRPTHTSVTHSQGSRLPGGNPRGCPRRERPKFLEKISIFPILLISSISLPWSMRKAFFFLSLLAILWNHAFRWVYLSFSSLPLASLLFSAICKASSDSKPFPFCISFP